MLQSPVEMQEAGAGQKRDGFIVLGMHRSGTSAITGTLIKLGAAAPNTPLLGGSDNLKGHWESIPMIAFHDELLASAGSKWNDWRPIRSDWYDTPVADQFKARAKTLLMSEFGDSPTFVLKDPRICRFTRFWLEIFAEEGISPRIVLPFRNPLEVAHSLKARDGIALSEGLLLWLVHALEGEAATRAMPRAIVDWSAFLKDWRLETDGIAKTLDIRWPRLTDATSAEIDAFLTSDLKHERATDEQLRHHPDVHAWVMEAYAALQELRQNPGSNSARATLDDVRSRYIEASSLFGRSLLTSENAAQALRVEVSASQNLNTALASEKDQLASELLALTAQHEQALAAEQARLMGLLAEKEQLAAAAKEAVEAQERLRDEQLASEVSALTAQHEQAFAAEQARLMGLIVEKEQLAAAAKEAAETQARLRDEQLASELATLSAQHGQALEAEQARLMGLVAENEQLAVSATEAAETQIIDVQQRADSERQALIRSQSETLAAEQSRLGELLHQQEQRKLELEATAAKLLGEQQSEKKLMANENARLKDLNQEISQQLRISESIIDHMDSKPFRTMVRAAMTIIGLRRKANQRQ